MTTISPSQMRRVARDLMNDAADGRENRASRNDGQILARMVESGTTSRAGLDAVIDEIEKSDLPMDRKKQALKVLEGFKERTATGFASKLFSVDEAFLDRLSYQGIDDAQKLLTAGNTAAKRQHLASQVGSTEPEIRRLVKQADLLRIDSIDPKLAHVLLAVGIDSVPELGQRNAANLQDKLDAFAKSQEGYVIGFKAPSASEMDAMVAAAKALPRVVEFGSVEDSFTSLSLQERLDMYAEQDDSLRFRSFDGGDTLQALFSHLGAGALPEAIAAIRRDAIAEIGYELDNYDIDVPDDVLAGLGSYDDLVEWVATNIGDSEADSLGNGWADFKNPSDIEIIKSGNEVVGARFQFTRILDGDHDYYNEYYYDVNAGRIIGMTTGGYEVDSDTSLIGPADPLSGSKTAALVKELGANGVNDLRPGQGWLTVGADAHEADTITGASLEALFGNSTDKPLTVRPFADDDKAIADTKAALSAADATKFQTALDLAKTKLTGMVIAELPGGRWDESDRSTFFIGGFDESENFVYFASTLKHDNS